MIECDVAVMGAGVAGSTVAALLAQGGLHVTLIEKGTLPRQKVCGEFLSPEGVDVLKRVGVWPLVEAEEPPRIDGFALTAGNYTACQRLPTPGWGVSRWLLDYGLWQHAKGSGVTTLERCQVGQVSGNFEDGFCLTLQPAACAATSLRAQAVICAAGRHWQPRGHQHQPRRPRHKAQFVGFKAHFRDVPLHRRVELHSLRQGYCGMVEVTGGVTNLCCWIEAEALRCVGRRPQQWFAAALAESVHLQQRLQRAEPMLADWTTTSIIAGQRPTPVTSQVWNIGDRAAMVAPLTGDGMGMALRAAELAATLMLEVFRHQMPWELATRQYGRRWLREFLPRLRWGRGLEALLLHPSLAALSCAALRYSPGLMSQLYCRTRQRPARDALTMAAEG